MSTNPGHNLSTFQKSIYNISKFVSITHPNNYGLAFLFSITVLLYNEFECQSISCPKTYSSFISVRISVKNWQILNLLNVHGLKLYVLQVFIFKLFPVSYRFFFYKTNDNLKFLSVNIHFRCYSLAYLVMATNLTSDKT